MKKPKLWAAAVALLVIAGLFFRFVLIGYDFIGYGFVFAAAVVAAYRFAGKALRLAITLLLIAGLSFFAVCVAPVIAAASGDENVESDCLIVLGAGVNGTQPSLSLKNRLDAAIAYLVTYPNAVAVVSGGRGPGEDITEAECMNTYLTENGIDPERIIMESRAASTEENFAFSFEILADMGYDLDKGVAAVSSEYHLYRAKLLAAAQGVEIKTVPAETSYPLLMTNYFIREGFAAAYMRVFN